MNQRFVIRKPVVTYGVKERQPIMKILALEKTSKVNIMRNYSYIEVITQRKDR
jgi:hypothetical protein